MDFDTLDNNFMNLYDELGQLNTASTRQITEELDLKEVTREEKKKDYKQLTEASVAAKAKQTAHIASKIAFLGGALASLFTFNPVPILAGLLARITTGTVITGVENAQVNKALGGKSSTNKKVNIGALLDFDPSLKGEVIVLIEEVGQQKAAEVLSVIEDYLNHHPELLKMSPEELEQQRPRLDKMFIQAYEDAALREEEAAAKAEVQALKGKGLKESFFTHDILQKKIHQELAFSQEEKNSCLQKLKSYPNLNELVKIDALSFLVCLTAQRIAFLGYLETFRLQATLSTADEDWDDIFTDLFKVAETNLANSAVLRKYKRQQQTEGTEESKERYLNWARSLITAGIDDSFDSLPVMYHFLYSI